MTLKFSILDPRVLITGAILLSGCTLIVATQARAADASACTFTIEQATAAAQAKGGSVLSLVDVPGDGADQVLVADVGGAIQAWPALKGCMVGTPTSLIPSKKPDVPA